MECCKHYNFRNTKKCEIERICERLEEGEIDQETAQDLYDAALLHCEEQYYDDQLED